MAVIAHLKIPKFHIRVLCDNIVISFVIGCSVEWLKKSIRTAVWALTWTCTRNHQNKTEVIHDACFKYLSVTQGDYFISGQYLLPRFLGDICFCDTDTIIWSKNIEKKSHFYCYYCLYTKMFKGFWQWCTTLSTAGALDFVHWLGLKN